MGQFAPWAPPDVAPLLAKVELRLACTKCAKKQHVITYTLNPIQHSCVANLLLSRSRDAVKVNEWHEVRLRPSFRVPAHYAVCWHYRPTKGCLTHFENCSFAWTIEEVHVWSFEKSHKLERSHLVSLLLNNPSPGASTKEPSSWEDILSTFGGHFYNVCEQCFYQSPRKVTLTDLCQSHPRPVPLLAHIITDNTKKQCHAIRPMPYAPHIRMCPHSNRGFLCREENSHCPNAHSEVELAVWKLEHKYGCSRSAIQEDTGENIGFYCRLCLVSASTQENFEAHCSSLEHGRLLEADSLQAWNHRDPPERLKKFVLCENPSQCIYGEGCEKAHSQEELQEWILRVKINRRNRQVVEEESLQSYRDRLMQEFQHSSIDNPVLSEEGEGIKGVKITCDSPLEIKSIQKPVKTVWNFTIHSTMPLLHVALLKMDPGATFSLSAQGLPDLCHYSPGSNFQIKAARTHCYKIRVCGECSVFGVFEKWLTLDFGVRPVLLQRIIVQVGIQEEISKYCEGIPQQDSLPRSSERWNPSKQLCFPCKERTQEEEKLLDLYKPPSMNPSYGGRTSERQTLTEHNYREVMHIRLLQEEAAREEVIARLNLKTDVTLSKMVSLINEMKIALPGELFAAVPLPKALTKDTEEGYLLQRSVYTALVAFSPQKDNKVYEVHVETSSDLDSSVLLRFPERCCRELSLQPETSTKLEIQFQLDRLQFCIYHEAIDRLLDVALLLPDLSRCCDLPTSQEQMSWGNNKQKLAISYITATVTGKQPVAPLVIYGPFGTGKTSTMAKAALQVIKQAGTRVLICTHNNSAADLYIEEHLHPYVVSGHPEATPLRVKYTKSPVNRTSPTTLQYCILSDDKSSFANPNKSLLDKHRIIVTTAVTARDLDVPRGCFTHILLDEAAQMMESEALIPLALMNHRSRVVVAGDHMQEAPRFFHQTGVEEHTLLTRLFTYYQSKDCPAAKKSRIVFHQNYRSAPAIISFVSRCFYVKRDNAIEACAVAPMEPPQGCQALSLFHVHGYCTAEGNSWKNVLEAQQVVETVKDVLQRWPEKWGRVKGSKICVVSHGAQVKLIRQELRKVRLSDVNVTNYDNVLGREFLVIILSTVRSIDSLPTKSPTSSTFSLDFFCDPRVLNTILTRARAQVIVVGDVVALCSFGACSRIWRSYLRECVEAGSASPADLSVEGIKQMASERQAWRQDEEEEEDAEEDSDSWTTDVDINAEDAILQELLDSKEETYVTVSAEGMLEMKPSVSFKKDVPRYMSFPTHTLKQYLKMQPNIYKKCQLVKEAFDRGYAVTLDDGTPCHITINGRENCGMGFNGDVVVVEMLPDVHPDAGKVVGVLEAGEKNRRFVCLMETHDSNIMVPVDRTVTKIFCPKFKEKPNFIPIRTYQNGRITTLRFEKVTREMTRSTLFLVQIVRWREGFYYPLGIVTQVFPQNLTLQKGLEILDLEFGIENGDVYPKEASEEADNLSEKIQIKDRRDCTGMLTFTVDPLSAKDLDDAISIREEGECYEIGIHITDLAAVIPQGSHLDSEAKKRGVTFYSPTNDPVHMLPHKLCSDLCSLKPKCKRMAISLFVLVEKESDQMVEGHFCRSVICSDRQLSYEEANLILEVERDKPRTFDTIEGCLCIAEHFSNIHRSFRLEKAANYKQPDEDCLPGSREAQRMIEELMIMYNSWVAEYLTNKDDLINLTPVRCQNALSFQKIEEMRKRFEHILPLSTYLSHHLLVEPELPRPSSGQKVTMLASVWNQLKDTTVSSSKITDLLSTDDLHPELSYAVREFRSQLGRSYFTRSGTPNANGHYSLQLCDYTWASSPLRRYIDIVLQRLLQGILTGQSDLAPRINPKDMDLLCLDFDRKNKRASSYQKRAHVLKLASSLRTVVQQKVAVIMTVDATNRSFKANFPLHGDSLPNPMVLEYCHLQPEKQPKPTETGLRLSWRRRVYSYNNYKGEPLRNLRRTDIIAFDSITWHEAIRAMNQGQPDRAIVLLSHSKENSAPMSFVTRSSCGHFMEITFELQAGKSLPVQLGTMIERGFPTPSPQLCTLAPGIDLCLEHTARPIECFSSLARRAPLKTYANVKDYQAVWLPLCAMEAAESAVKEGGPILLRDVPVKWKKTGNSKETVGLKGTFKLTPILIKECELHVDFQNCYLCVRLEGLPAKAQNLSDLQSYTWVAHGLTEYSTSVSKEEGGNVDFRLHQCNMIEVPEKALRSTDPFTLEIIPKLLPDIRKERAVKDLNNASELTKSIALGKKVSEVVQNEKFKTQTSFAIPERPRPLNQSQTEAVRKALTQPFTLIQGPPGTGKTVVGVHLVYWFHHINKATELAADNETEEKEGQRILMYCGPSNKSVDVVSEMLLPLRDKLRPLRVYSEQMELSEFPYPGSNLRLTGYLREGKPNDILRPIALHHLIRQPPNSYWRQIQEMDHKIRSGQEMTPEQIDEYKGLISKARKEELARHDIILCTCVASSSKMLTELPITQVIIDECGMCTEPESLVPLVSHQHVQSVVLIGDHRQLRPVVMNDICKILKMDHSLFERFEDRALFLNTQYRMHEDICAFPSKEFYDKRLRTSPEIKLRNSLFSSRPLNLYHRIVFGDVEGQEQSLVVTTEEGNVNSKANLEEAKKAVELAGLLVYNSVEPSDIAILTAYNAQVAEVTRRLHEIGQYSVTVSTIMKSQGSEWRYVIFSTVRSATAQELDSRPTISWQRRYLGFLGDPNQINVALTRAKEGLCILGNAKLLRCSPMWNRLLQHYSQKGARVNAADLTVRQNRHR